VEAGLHPPPALLGEGRPWFGHAVPLDGRHPLLDQERLRADVLDGGHVRHHGSEHGEHRDREPRRLPGHARHRHRPRRSVNAIDASNRRLLESDTKVGYRSTRSCSVRATRSTLSSTARVRASDAFLLCKDRIKPRPLNGRAMFTIAGQDWVDGKKRRILGEWGLEVRQPQVAAYFNNQS
jgi:hypothetical protein